MPCTPLHTDEQGHVHSGALASIVDVAGVAASWSLVPSRQGARGSTVGMQLSYPGVTTGDVVADAYVQQRCEELFFSTVHVSEAKTGQLVSMGQVSYRLLEAHESSF
jgi:acyl-coenzyme A thioesterase PaaI-like protein